MHSRFAPLLLIGLITSASLANDSQVDIPLALVPKAVMEAVKKKFPEATPESASKGVEDGQPFYDVQVKLKARNAWITCDPQGHVLSVDREISFQELPKGVVGAVSKKYPKAAIRGVNEIVEGPETIYDVALTFNGKKIVAVFEASGKYVEESEDDEP